MEHLPQPFPLGELMACSSGCPTQNHATWGECIRSKNLRTNAMQPEHVTAQKSADKTLDQYQLARSYGIQPKSTRSADVQTAMQISDQTGTAFKA